MNDYAGQVFGTALGELGKSLLQYHPRKSRDRVLAVLNEMIDSPTGEPRTVVIDILGKTIMYNLSRLTITSPVAQTCWAVTFVDVTEQTGAEINPLRGMVEMKKIPVAVDGSYSFLSVNEVLCVQSDGDYCKVFTAADSFYLHFSLKTILQRYPSAAFFRVHKSYVVNLDHIKNAVRSGKDRLTVVLDNLNIQPIPVSRHRITDLKRAMAHR